MLFFNAVVLASLTSFALATVFITSPVDNSVFTGGEKTTITWKDTPDAPSLAQWGNCKVSIYTGNAIQQTQLQEITPSIDVSKINTIEFTPDASIGPNGKFYFIRIESLKLKDAKSPQYPALAFSAKFEMKSMTGKFSAAVQAQVDDEKANPIGGGSSTTPTTTLSSSTSSSSSPTKVNNAAASSTQSNAASPAYASSMGGFKPWMGILVSMAAGALLL